MRFENGNLLWLLLAAIPALIAFFWWAGRERERITAQFIEARLLPALMVGLSTTRQKIRRACLIAAVALAVIVMARPQWGFDWEETKLRGLDIVVAIDTSKSMLATDIVPNRLTRAKLAALDLMQQAKSDRLGLVAFAGRAFLQCPLTADDTAFRQSVEALDVNIIPQGGTAIAEAINTASTAFKEGDNHKVLVLFTDGEDNDEGALESAKAAAEVGMKIFTVGIGTAAGEMVRYTDANGSSDYVRDEHGSVLKSHLNEQLLSEIASATDGRYLLLSGAKTMDVLYEQGLSPLPKSDSAAKLVKRYHERFHWPLAAAIVLLMVEMLIPARKRERKSERTVSNQTNPVTVVALATILVLPQFVAASPASALKDFRAQMFPAAQQEYERLAATDEKGDLRLVFNAGTAAYNATNYDVAAKHFSAVLAARDLKLQQAAHFNLGNTQFRNGQSAKDLDGMQAAWESAVKCYQNAVALNPNDLDAAYNLAFTKRLLEQIAELREAARRAKEAADSATRKRNYHRAVEIMEGLLKSNPTAKQFEEFTKKLKDIDAIVTPDQP